MSWRVHMLRGSNGETAQLNNDDGRFGEIELTEQAAERVAAMLNAIEGDGLPRAARILRQYARELEDRAAHAERQAGTPGWPSWKREEWADRAERMREASAQCTALADLVEPLGATEPPEAA